MDALSDVVAAAEGELRSLAAHLTRVREDECLACYLERMLADARGVRLRRRPPFQRALA
jgi:hypothetical protein